LGRIRALMPMAPFFMLSLLIQSSIECMGPSMIRVPHLSLGNPFQGLPNWPFSSLFPWPVLHFTLFFMSNEIILFKFLCRPLKYLLYSLMKVIIVKFIQCGPCSINGPKFPEIWLFESFYIVIGIWFLSHSCILYTLTHKVFVVKTLSHCLDILYESLNFFFFSWNSH